MITTGMPCKACLPQACTVAKKRGYSGCCGVAIICGPHCSYVVQSKLGMRACKQSFFIVLKCCVTAAPMKGTLRRTSEFDAKHQNGMSGQLRGARANRLAEASREFPGQFVNWTKQIAGWNSLDAALGAEKVTNILNPGCIRAALIKSLH